MSDYPTFPYPNQDPSWLDEQNYNPPSKPTEEEFNALSDEVGGLDERVTALEQGGGGGGSFTPSIQKIFRLTPRGVFTGALNENPVLQCWTSPQGGTTFRFIVKPKAAGILKTTTVSENVWGGVAKDLQIKADPLLPDLYNLYSAGAVAVHLKPTTGQLAGAMPDNTQYDTPPSLQLLLMNQTQMFATFNGPSGLQISVTAFPIIWEGWAPILIES